jgi:hypothetical protein
MNIARAFVAAVERQTFTLDQWNCIRDSLVARYAKLDACAKLVDAPLANMLSPSTLVAMRIALDLRAYAEWSRTYVLSTPGQPVMMDSCCLAMGLDAKMITIALGAELLNRSRMALNNLNQGADADDAYESMSRALNDAVTAPSDLAQALRSGNSEEGLAAIGKLCDTAAVLWSIAVERPILEKIDGTWLRRFLTFDIGTRYKAWKDSDLLFAIYKVR